MDDDRRVRSLSNAEVRSFAKKLREYFGLKDASRVDVIACLKRARIWTIRGERPLTVEIRPDEEMNGADAKTTSRSSGVRIEIERSVYRNAEMGEGRSRNTIAHEFGHAVLHEGAEMPRLARGNATPVWLPAYESAEHQVKVFAAAFLINDQVAETLPNASEISIEFGISVESAEIYYNDLLERREREQTVKKIRTFAEELARESAPATPKTTYLSTPCSNCGNATVFPVGPRFMCRTCNAISDRLQDGDPGFENLEF